MHFALASVALFAALALASTLFASQDVSSCISECVKNGDRGNCSETDYNCLCNNTVYIDSVMGCVRNTCPSDLAAAQEAGRELCLPFGVTLPPTAVFIESSTTSVAEVYGSASARTTTPASSTTVHYTATMSSTPDGPAATSKSAGSSVDFGSFAGLAACAGLAGLLL